MSDTLPRAFDFAEAEPRIYQRWEGSGAFAARPDSNARPYTIMIPPPNVTGSLHVGHALTFTLQDVLIRWRRMQGYDALWQSGTDHAGIATQMVVERQLAEEGTTRREMGRDAFEARVWQWKAESGGTITRQLRRLGASLDWSRERFTLDEGLSRAVRKVFVSLYADGLIYRDRRLVNWDPVLGTAISDLEVEAREVRGSLWYLRYPVKGGDTVLTVATTRPETMLGDTAVAVHPTDARYADLVGRHVVLPLTGRRIPIVADEYSDPGKGTGAVKITPAHDFNDFAVGQRHGLAMPSVLDKTACVTLAEIAGDLRAAPGVAEPDFVRSLDGVARVEARKAIVAELERLGLLERVEPHTHQVPHGDRSGAVIEPLLTMQWYCDAATLAKPALEAVERGRTVFVPKQWENTYFAWMRDIQPWCVSRQLWWGHRIPAWYGPDGRVFVAETADEAAGQARAAYGDGVALSQDEDVLDTWFSSALWPFSTLGWPEATPELARYYPTDVLVTGFDIIFFWVARMMMMGLRVMGDVPFRTVIINALVRDERGQKMSKSKGNVVDPLAMIDAYGADALRWTVCQLAGPGRDIALGPKRVEQGRAFVTKLWNAARFCEMNGVAGAMAPTEGFVTPLCRWIVDAANAATAEATASLEASRFDDYAGAVYRFTWNVFCDWFVELAKPAFADAARAGETRAAAAHALRVVLRLLHPAAPFVTEALWERFGDGESLIRAAWPEPAAVADAAAARAEIDWVTGVISAVRTVRAGMNVPPSVRVPVLLRDAAPATMARAAAWAEAFARMARADGVRGLDGAAPAESARVLAGETELVLPLAGLIDVAAERARLGRERAKALDEAGKIARKLDNAEFVAKAPEAVVAENRERLRAAEADAARLGEALSWLG